MDIMNPFTFTNQLTTLTGCAASCEVTERGGYFWDIPALRLRIHAAKPAVMDRTLYNLVLRRGTIAEVAEWLHTVNWTKIDPNGPGLSSPRLFGDVGHDLAATFEVDIPPLAHVMVDTNVQLEMPPTLFGWTTARSSFAKRLLMVPNGILDAGYRGPLWVPVLNMTNEHVVIKQDERIAQVIFQPRMPIQAVQVEQFSYPTERATAGFGSTGTH